MRPLLLFPLLVIAARMNAQTSPLTFQSTEQQTALIELYTSEGCSSCPPAETWLSQLKEAPGLWKNFVPLAFHVDYWDYLGWRDRWAASRFSDRQRAYAGIWRSESIYTPCLVLDGREWRNWYGEKAGPRPSGAKVGVLTVNSLDTNRWQVTFAPANTSATSYDVHAALTASGLNSEVKAGENQGRRLRHDFAVLDYMETNLTRSGQAAKGEFVLPLRKDAQGGKLALAVWITEAGRREPLQAAGGWLFRALPSP